MEEREKGRDGTGRLYKTCRKHGEVIERLVWDERVSSIVCPGGLMDKALAS